MNNSTTAGAGRKADNYCVARTLDLLGIDHNRASKMFRCPIPGHEDTEPSASYGSKDGDTSLWKCFACDKGGSAVDIVMSLKGCDYSQAKKYLEDLHKNGSSYPAGGVSQKKPPKVHQTLDDAIKALIYSRNRAASEMKKAQDWECVSCSEYRDAARLIVAYAVRLESPSEKSKTFGQITPRDGGYVARGPDSGVPPLNLPSLDRLKPVVICEGEKAASAAEKLGLQSTTWIGGSGAVDKTDWATLKGFDCVIWPDNDKPGLRAATAIADKLAGIASSIRVLSLPDGLPDKSDAFDILSDYGASEGRKWFDDVLKSSEPVKARPIVVIPVDFNNPAELLSEILPHLEEAGVYQREGGLCRIRSGEVILDDTRVNLSGAHIDPHDAASLGLAVGSAVSLYRERIDDRGNLRSESCAPSAELMKQLLRMPEYPHIRYLAGVTSAPIFRPDGSICGTPGYDRRTGWFYDGEPINVPLNPTDEDAALASSKLLGLVSEFEWNAEHRAAWLGYLLTLLARPGIVGNVPAFVFTATTPGAGKSLLVNIANIIAYGVHPAGYQPSSSQKDSNDEWRKAFFSFARAGSPSLVVSNYPSGEAVGNSILDMVLTERRIVDRVLRESRTEGAAWVAVVAITGNNLQTMADFSFRSIWSVLEPTTAAPRMRCGFAIADLAAHVTENRREYLIHALTILRWHAARGFPASGGKHYGSFERWAQVIRDPILSLESVDICRNIEAAEIGDAEQDELSNLLAGLAEYSQSKRHELKANPNASNNAFIDRNSICWFNFAELYRDLKAHPTAWGDLQSLVDVEKSSKQFNAAFGKVIKKHKGRVGSIKLNPSGELSHEPASGSESESKTAQESVRIAIKSMNNRTYLSIQPLKR
jgi:hypothetical protein